MKANKPLHDHAHLREYLDNMVHAFNQPGFIEDDPVSIPHLFTRKRDIEIAGFLTATLAWGNRKSILANGRRLMAMMDNAPADFLINAKPRDLRPFLQFVHRTFSGEDCLFFLTSLQHIYRVHDSLEILFSSFNESGAAHAIGRFRNAFLESSHLERSAKHLANPDAGSAAKRINMFLRWMVRKDACGVDFGLWSSIDPANLVCPLDIHSGTNARSLGLLQRRQNDWQAAIQLTDVLRTFDAADPVKYDFALFGLSVNKGMPKGLKM